MRFDPFGILARRDLRERRRAAEEYARTVAKAPGPERWAPMSPERKAKLMAHAATAAEDIRPTLRLWNGSGVSTKPSGDVWPSGDDARLAAYCALGRLEGLVKAGDEGSYVYVMAEVRRLRDYLHGVLHEGKKP